LTDNNVEVHPNGLLIVKDAKNPDSGLYQCHVRFPYSPQVEPIESSYELQVQREDERRSDQSYYQPVDSEKIQVTVSPREVTVINGESATITCEVTGTNNNYKITWGKYAHDTALPDYVRQIGNSIIISPPQDLGDELNYYQCQADVDGQPNPFHEYAVVSQRASSSASKKRL